MASEGKFLILHISLVSDMRSAKLKATLRFVIVGIFYILTSTSNSFSYKEKENSVFLSF